MISDSTAIEPSLSLLEWDSKQFGFPVGRIDGAQVCEATLRQLLVESRNMSLRLVYWFDANADSAYLAADVLRDFAGNLITQKATFERRALRPPNGLKRGTCGTILVEEYEQGPPSTELLELGVAAGAESRFRLDPLFPREAFEHLYSTWVLRSTFHEIADVVLVAREQDRTIVGFVTLAKQAEEIGAIGLIAVAASVRGRGVGSLLIEAAHEWMAREGISRAQVVTQLGNSAACRLYERNGYSLTRVENVYHFWPQL
jgi:GNAT superfamily N-acetyltransferase